VAFTFSPRYPLYKNGLASPAADAPHGVNENHGYLPQRNEMESPGRQVIMAWPWAAALRTDRLAITTRLDGNFDRITACGNQRAIPVNE